ncbi:hypothetical protein BP6252_13412 [Coleophoma cylindrospora]|uniref:Uncharacterized protein n=1 Tax=Coleophoma cylindrospora TaxID=1849047 RepID=A0A3D8Q870_9HELO|nr:hypothetical protein BP6252_13412 [Coleophoma cylindrospora]
MSSHSAVCLLAGPIDQQQHPSIPADPVPSVQHIDHGDHLPIIRQISGTTVRRLAAHRCLGCLGLVKLWSRWHCPGPEAEEAAPSGIAWDGEAGLDCHDWETGSSRKKVERRGVERSGVEWKGVGRGGEEREENGVLLTRRHSWLPGPPVPLPGHRAQGTGQRAEGQQFRTYCPSQTPGFPSSAVQCSAVQSSPVLLTVPTHVPAANCHLPSTRKASL